MGIAEERLAVLEEVGRLVVELCDELNSFMHDNARGVAAELYEVLSEYLPADEVAEEPDGVSEPD